MLDHDVPDDLSYLLEQLGHDVTLLRKALPGDSTDEAVLRFAHERQLRLIDGDSSAESRTLRFEAVKQVAPTSTVQEFAIKTGGSQFGHPAWVGR